MLDGVVPENQIIVQTDKSTKIIDVTNGKINFKLDKLVNVVAVHDGRVVCDNLVFDLASGDLIQTITKISKHSNPPMQSVMTFDDFLMFGHNRFAKVSLVKWQKDRYKVIIRKYVLHTHKISAFNADYAIKKIILEQFNQGSCVCYLQVSDLFVYKMRFSP